MLHSWRIGCLVNHRPRHHIVEGHQHLKILTLMSSTWPRWPPPLFLNSCVVARSKPLSPFHVAHTASLPRNQRLTLVWIYRDTATSKTSPACDVIKATPPLHMIHEDRRDKDWRRDLLAVGTPRSHRLSSSGFGGSDGYGISLRVTQEVICTTE
jgi:hypothetical protein